MVCVGNIASSSLYGTTVDLGEGWALPTQPRSEVLSCCRQIRDRHGECMARLTNKILDDVKKDPWRKIKQEQELPEWFSGAGMVLAGIILAVLASLLIYKIVTDDSQPVTPAPNQAESAPQQQINPYEVEEEPEAAATDADSTDTGSSAPIPSASSSTDESADTEAVGDFASIETVSIPVETSSLNSRVPEGAMNVALAGAKAMSTGNWSGVPVDGSPREDRYLGSEIDEESVRLTEPVPSSADSDTQFTFLFDGKDKSGGNVQLSITTQWGDDAYEVVAF